MGDRIRINRKMFKPMALIFLATLSIAMVHFSPVKTYFELAVMEEAVRATGLWGPAVFMLFSIVGICVFVPGTVFLALAVALFGPYRGFLYLWAAALTASSLSFLISRTLGRNFAARMIGRRLARYDDLIERNGFTAVLYIRLMCVPFSPANYGLGLSKVRTGDYLLGTALGEAVSIFVFTFLLGTLKRIWLSGDWAGLLSFRVFLSFGLVAISISIPWAVYKMRRNKDRVCAGKTT